MSNYCAWHKVRYEAETCSKCDLATWSDQRKGGCIVVFFFWPVCMAGLWIGALWSAFWSGFTSARGLWDDAWKWIRAKKPGKKENDG